MSPETHPAPRPDAPDGTESGEGPRSILASSTFRLALLYMLLLGTSVAILLVFIYWSTAGYMSRQTDATIGAEIQGLAEQYRRAGLTGLSALIAERIARDPGGASVYLLADEQLQPLVSNLDRWPSGEPDANGWIAFRLRERGPDKAEEHTARAKVFRLRGGLRLLVGRDVRDLVATRELILDALAWGFAMTAALALLGGWLMSAGVMRRLETINQVSRGIIDGDLSRRVPTDGTGDDFDQLAVNLNRMLERIESLMTSVRQVSDHIAHDLRTPLSRMRTRLELLRGNTAKDDAREEVDACINDAEELLATFNALLRIARIESGNRRAEFADVDLAPLLHDVAELYEPIATDKEQQLRVGLDPDQAAHTPGGSTDLRVHGDRDLLFQAVANLVDNAIKYTPRGGEIHVGAAHANGQIEVTVSDTGPGVPPALRTKVFQRFFRVDDSRATAGNGLGLSLVQAVAQIHDATIRLDDNDPGLRVTLGLAPGPVHHGRPARAQRRTTAD